MNKISGGIIYGIIVCCIGCKESGKTDNKLKYNYMSIHEKGIISEHPASFWEESLITGNGTIGLTILSNPLKDRIIIGHEDLFLPLNPPNTYVPMWEKMDSIRSLILNHRSREADSLVVAQGKKYGYNETVWTNPLVPAGEMQFQIMNQDTVIQDYLRSVNYETGEAVITYKVNEHVIQRKMFVSRDNKMAVMKVCSPDGEKINCRIRLTQLPLSTKDSAIVNKCIKSSISETDNPWVSYSVEFNQLFPKAIKGYSIVSRVFAPKAQMKSQDGFLVVENADSLTVLTSVKIFDDSENVNNEILISDINACSPNYNVNLEKHAKIHAEMYDRMTLSLGPQNKKKIANGQNESVSNSNDISLSRIKSVFDACRYELVSSTGKLPPTLQGIWGGTWRPAWSSDFTQDGNVQAVISGGLNCNYFEVTKAYLDYITKLLPDFRNNAKKIFNLRGIWIPSRTSEHGQVLHFNVGFPGLFWIAGAAWVSQFYFDYWKYTSDDLFLENQAIPFMLESVRFYDDYLIKGKDGKLMVIPSYSPENVPLNEKSASVINATMDVASIRQLLFNLLELNKTHKFDKKEVTRWEYMLENLPKYDIGQDGALKEWIWPGYLNFEDHRHASHLFPLFFGVDPVIKNNPKLMEACRIAIEKRLEYRRKNNGGDMAFGLVQLGMAAANLRDTIHAEECIHWLCNSYWTENLNSYHNPGGIFNVDIAGGLPAIIVQMLLQSNEKNIELLPVLPESWVSGEIKGIRAKGGFAVNISWENHKLKNAKVISLSGNILSLSYQGNNLIMNTEKDKTYIFTKDSFKTQ